MTSLAIGALTLTAAIIAEMVFPGRNLYHTGWYNVALLALTAVSLRISLRQRAALIACGAIVLAIAGIACGLFAPDNRSIVAAPGQRVPVADLGGTLEFPLARGGAIDEPVVLLRKNHAPVTIDNRSRNVGSYVLRTVGRPVVYVQASDSHGSRLTVTQPTGIAFLSPVLLMQQDQVIAGLDLPFDSFAVPAAHRIVKAVLFTPQQAAALRGMSGLAIPAVLFAVDDEEDRPLPHAIAVAISGQTVPVESLLLRAIVLQYPSVEVVAVPSLPAVALGTLLVLGGLIVRPVRRNGS